jgi:SAM-dependent methyltransferase
MNLLLTCPVCRTQAPMEVSNRTSLKRMADALEHPLPAKFEGAGASIAICPCCCLEFAVPMRAPGPEFYQWLIESGLRYHSDRWEWHVYAARIRQRSAASGSGVVVVDFGCGDGGFIRQIGTIAKVRALGLDHNPEVVARCREQDLDVIEGGLQDLALKWPGGVDAVTFWHVVEHVENPVELLESARERLRKGGELCFSVPLTPMSYEHSWPDPFNEPPHHLTRWSVPALEALAKTLGMEMELVLPSPASLVSRVFRSLSLQAIPSLAKRGRVSKSLRFLAFLIQNPIALSREVVRQMQHPRHDGKMLPDVALVVLRL